jgi:hypothetical protein
VCGPDEGPSCRRARVAATPTRCRLGPLRDVSAAPAMGTTPLSHGLTCDNEDLLYFRKKCDSWSTPPNILP